MEDIIELGAVFSLCSMANFLYIFLMIYHKLEDLYIFEIFFVKPIGTCVCTVVVVQCYRSSPHVSRV